MTELGDLTRTVLSPGALLGHAAYLLLIVSMMMRTMKWLRALAIGSGIVSVFYGWLWLADPVTVFWETLFVLVNGGQLAWLELENRYARFDQDERFFVRQALPGPEKAQARRLLRLGFWRNAEPESELTREGEMAEELIFILRGRVRIESGGRVVGTCTRGDFLGEISFMSGKPATATCRCADKVRYLAFHRGPLADLLSKDASLRSALENAFNRNLVGKLVKSNQGPAGDAPG